MGHWLCNSPLGSLSPDSPSRLPALLVEAALLRGVTERAMRKAFDFFAALAITLALLLALTIAAATVAIKSALKELAREPASRTSGGA
jgi:hypothetical protein